MRASINDVGLTGIVDLLSGIETSPYPVAVDHIQIEHYQPGDSYRVKVGVLTFDKKELKRSRPDSATAKAGAGQRRLRRASTCQRSRNRNLLLWGGCAAFFLFCFVVFAYLTFPYERVRDVLVSKVQASNAPGAPATKLSIGELGPNWLTGVALTSVALERAARDAGRAADASSPRTNSSCASSPFKLLFGGVGVALRRQRRRRRHRRQLRRRARTGRRTSRPSSTRSTSARVGLGSLLGLPLSGEATGNDRRHALGQAGRDAGQRRPAHRAREARRRQGRQGQGAGHGRRRSRSTRSTPARSRSRSAIKDGVATIERFESKGKDLELSGSGSMRLARDARAVARRRHARREVRRRLPQEERAHQEHVRDASSMQHIDRRRRRAAPQAHRAARRAARDAGAGRRAGRGASRAPARAPKRE